MFICFERDKASECFTHYASFSRVCSNPDNRRWLDECAAQTSDDMKRTDKYRTKIQIQIQIQIQIEILTQIKIQIQIQIKIQILIQIKIKVML